MISRHHCPAQAPGPRGTHWSPREGNVACLVQGAGSALAEGAACPSVASSPHPGPSTSMSHGILIPLPLFLCLAPWLCCRVLQWSLPLSYFWVTSSIPLLISWHLLFLAGCPPAQALLCFTWLLPGTTLAHSQVLAHWGIFPCPPQLRTGYKILDFGCMVLIRN